MARLLQKDKLPLDVNRDLVPIGLTGKDGFLLAVSPKLGVNSLAELIALAKKDPHTGVHPREWTGSGCGFDHLPGVLLLERDGAAISKRGVQPLAVVDLVDEARQ